MCSPIKRPITLCKIGLRSYADYRIKGAGVKNVRFMDGGLDMWTYENNQVMMLGCRDARKPAPMYTIC